VRLLQDFTTDSTRCAPQSTAWWPRPDRALPAAYDAAQLATQAGTPRRYVVLLTDATSTGG